MISMPAPVPFMVDTSMLCSDTNGSPYLFDISTTKQTDYLLHHLEITFFL